MSSKPRPPRKAYNKLGSKEEQTKATGHLDNDASPKKDDLSGNGNSGNDTDTDSSFTDIEIDDGNEFSDSDYGELKLLSNSIRMFRALVKLFPVLSIGKAKGRSEGDSFV
ncbi:hypothetical protein WA026_019720 [Henosepilachna vigintioctopunctata]|uniref:Uncharacterized protein n=1 Tax=Henosepilachna vigintioctopunctata TaxID=420089 RepID=A0AAW1UF39_9CUCU